MKNLMMMGFMLLSMLSCKKKSAPAAVTIKTATAVQSYAGKDRIKLTWTVPAGQAIAQCVIYWGRDSIKIPVQASGGMDSAVISHLPEGNYTFALVNIDQNGHRSGKVNINGKAYGQQYAGSLHNRPVQDVDYDDAGAAVTISWNDAAAGAIGTEIKYKDSTGALQDVFVPVYLPATGIKKIKAETDSLILYRTLFLPELTAIDTFYTDYDTLRIQAPSTTGYFDPGYTHALLKADGQTDTYTLINSVLGGTAEETPDCSHPSFGPHIRQEFNQALNESVFAFYLHVKPDNDRCKNFDRQRCEIKTYGPSPDSVKAFKGDEMIFKWKFKLDAGFQPSYSFTHIHQIKAGDGPNDGAPIITITPRFDDPEKLEIIHTGDNSSTSLGKVKRVDLAPFKGNWVQAVEKIKFGTHGTYSLVLKKVSDGTILLSYSNNDMDLWRTGSTFVRPKWGIYRSLNHPEQLRDEKVLFADFLIEKKK